MIVLSQRHFSYWLAIFLLGISVSACINRSEVDGEEIVSPDPASQTFTECGTAILYSVNGENGQMGVLEVGNDKNQIRIAFSPNDPYTMKEIHIEMVASTGQKKPVRPVELKSETTNENMNHISFIERDLMGDCVELSAVVKLNGPNGGIVDARAVGKEDVNEPSFRHCFNECIDRQPCTDIKKGDFRTLSVKEAMELQDNILRELAPGGFSFSCEGLENLAPEEVPVFLNDATLRSSWHSIEGEVGDALAAELLVLKLNMAMNEKAHSNLAHNFPFSELLVGEGAFRGWSVGEVLQEASSVAGDCPSHYGPEQMYDVVYGINLSDSEANTPIFVLECPR